MSWSDSVPVHMAPILLADISLNWTPGDIVAIGGSDTNHKYAKGGSIEFAAWKAILLFIGAGAIGTYFFSKEKERLRKQREMEQNRSVGKPLIGGPFSLVDTEGNKFTHENLKDENGKRFSIIYFGFSHCPDVCPEELDKLGEMLTELKKDNIEMQPIFITCDPARDTPEVIKTYLEDFHPDLVGLTGSYDQVKNCCKQYRVYFSTPPNVRPDQDYLVDHSIFFYVMDPEGNFVDVIGREANVKEGVEKIRKAADAFMPESERQKKQQSWLGFLYK
ncbi:cytochrome C oxidase assembly protein [Spathaspora passalidarum NRRL Y-27907]|uniref:Cytochrome C oxidase assembly protein n=1 Tax=Spathaspora passalidarum (strain NRRL Y-27907 / 11-Y1) TaxID=619300 RepID=G3AIY5_SPAPN|nr:cytochrome C oxidase assembly protein [Spathaspora passalidarum NRRL Y-27907]EGW33795.1 cytochrome C oxidase assembly protein [Spathaspora passalidarum NRRL Y-27907]